MKIREKAKENEFLSMSKEFMDFTEKKCTQFLGTYYEGAQNFKGQISKWEETMMSVMVQYAKYEESLLCSKKNDGYKNKPAHENQFAKSVEAALYAYPIWKISFEQCKHFYENPIFKTRYMNEWNENRVEEVGILRREYVFRIELIQETMTVLSPLQRQFIQQRYFEKMPFKIIASEMSVAERHLYRIRQDVIRIFAMSFGWQ